MSKIYTKECINYSIIILRFGITVSVVTVPFNNLRQRYNFSLYKFENIHISVLLCMSWRLVTLDRIFTDIQLIQNHCSSAKLISYSKYLGIKSRLSYIKIKSIS